MPGTSVKVDGLTELLQGMRGREWRDVNWALRQMAGSIAQRMVPMVEDAVRASPAPQARRVAGTVRKHSDRVPVVVVGKTNPFPQKLWRRSGTTPAGSKQRRGAIAHGVIYGPRGGHKRTPYNENYYNRRRDNSGAPFADALDGRILKQASVYYKAAFLDVLAAKGWEVN